MRFSISILMFALTVTFVQAYSPLSAEPSEQYATIPIEGDLYVERLYLGDLEDAPDLYEFKTDVAISIKIQILQRASKAAVPFGLIMVRQNDEDGGVEEIVRQNEPIETWEKQKSHALGMTFLKAPPVQIDIKPGTYRIEVSTPDNKGAYALAVGEESSWPGYFKSLWYALKTQHHFGLMPLRVLFSAYVYGTLGLLAVGYGLFRYRRYKKEHYDLTD